LYSQKEVIMATEDTAQESASLRSLGGLDEKTINKINAMTYEQARDELIKTVQSLDQGGAGLEESVKQWEYGTALARRASSILAAVRSQLEDVEKSQAQAGQSAGTQGNLETPASAAVADSSSSQSESSDQQ
jgi:exodeoxyribonuclease VII small subunit